MIELGFLQVSHCFSHRLTRKTKLKKDLRRPRHGPSGPRSCPSPARARARMASPCSLNSGARCAAGGSSSNCTGARGQPEGRSACRLAVLDVAVGDNLGVLRQFQGVLHHGPLADEVGQALRHSARGRARERRLQDGDGLAHCWRGAIRGRRSGGRRQVGAVDRVAHRGPVFASLEAAERQIPPILGQVVVDEGVSLEGRLGRRRPGGVGQQRKGRWPGPWPTCAAEQRDVHNRRLTGALPVEQGAHHPTGDGHGTDGVAEARARAARPCVRTRAG